jgi:hypothetical protein
MRVPDPHRKRPRHEQPIRFFRALVLDLRQQLDGYPHGEITRERMAEAREHIEALERDTVPTRFF